MNYPSGSIGTTCFEPLKRLIHTVSRFRALEADAQTSNNWLTLYNARSTVPHDFAYNAGEFYPQMAPVIDPTPNFEQNSSGVFAMYLVRLCSSYNTSSGSPRWNIKQLPSPEWQTFLLAVGDATGETTLAAGRGERIRRVLLSTRWNGDAFGARDTQMEAVCAWGQWQQTSATGTTLTGRI